MKAPPTLDKWQIDLLRDSFVAVLMDQERAGRLFYDRLFTIAPHLRVMFPADMATQERVLIQTLAMTVTGLKDCATLVPAIAALGRRHAAYGVRREHYAPVGEALLHMIAAMGGGILNPEVERAWRTAFAFVAHGMLAAVPEDQPTK